MNASRQLEDKQAGSTTYVFLVCIVAALGGLLFGYDTAVIAGAIGFLQAHFELDPTMKGWAASCALAGCVVGVALAGPVSDRFGRRNTLILSAVLFLISAIGTAIPRALAEFIIFRFIGGMGVGAASMTSPMYIAEISPARVRGRMVSVNQLAIVTGMLVVYFVNYFIGNHGTTLNRDQVQSLIGEHVPASVAQSWSGPARRALEDYLAARIDKYYRPTDIDTIKGLAEALQATLDEQTVSLVKLRTVTSSPQIDSAKANAAEPSDLTEVVATELARELSYYGLQFTERDTILLANYLAQQAINQARINGRQVAGTLLARQIIETVHAEEPPQWLAAEPPWITAMLDDLREAGARAWNVRRGWRWMFGSEALPALLLLSLLFFVPESPRWLTKQGRPDEALGILSRVDGATYAQTELAEIKGALTRESGSLRQLLQPGMKIVLVIGIVLAVLQQVTGINVFLYFGTEIFKKMGSETNAALLQTVIVGAVNLTFTVIAIWAVDKLGRKPLMMVGSAGMGICLLAMGVAAYGQATGLWILLFILGYIACFALSVGPVTWVILSEIFPTRIRGRAMAIATVCLWIANYVVSQTFPMMDENPWLLDTFHHALPFWVYGAFCAVLLAFVWAFVPETKGKTLEEIERRWMQ